MAVSRADQRPFVMIERRVTEKRWSAELHLSPVCRVTADCKIVRNLRPREVPGGLVPTRQMRYHMCRVMREWMVSGCVDGHRSPGPLPLASVEGKSRQLATPDRWSLIAIGFHHLIISLPSAISLFAGTWYCINGNSNSSLL